MCRAYTSVALRDGNALKKLIGPLRFPNVQWHPLTIQTLVVLKSTASNYSLAYKRRQVTLYPDSSLSPTAHYFPSQLMWISMSQWGNHQSQHLPRGMNLRSQAAICAKAIIFHRRTCSCFVSELPLTPVAASVRTKSEYNAPPAFSDTATILAPVGTGLHLVLFSTTLLYVSLFAFARVAWGGSVSHPDGARLEVTSKRRVHDGVWAPPFPSIMHHRW
ncbi:hypothetical protein BJ322DRAFT_542545 [Thelephora terrestris]|uniref:Uncharacterized protein n=1 Tax=Thelephora terrestris TaxID=56493 RepID=A0A9P6HLL7_9AGAM|nr:hypothetical protein BJ322DRAFT_542545 [Thelephora terrestris]